LPQAAFASGILSVCFTPHPSAPLLALMASHSDATNTKEPMFPRLLGRVHAAMTDVKQTVQTSTGGVVQVTKSLHAFVCAQPSPKGEFNGFDLADDLERGVAPAPGGATLKEDDIERCSGPEKGSFDDIGAFPFEGCFSG